VAGFYIEVPPLRPNEKARLLKPVQRSPYCSLVEAERFRAIVFRIRYLAVIPPVIAVSYINIEGSLYSIGRLPRR
jgi:hypothetical protein